MELLNLFFAWLSGAVWGMPLIILLTGTGLLFTVILRGVQWRVLTHGFDVLRGKYDNENDQGEISHFRALCAALSATMGLGNIVGVSVAIAAGGPGAVFWMWTVGFFGMATKFVSCTLSVMYRHRDEAGNWRGGPMWTIEKGLGPKWKWLAALFSLFCVFASFGIGNMFQSNQVAQVFNTYFEIPPWATGLTLAIMTAVVILGGIKRVGKVAVTLVPAMVLIYSLGSLYIIAVNFDKIPAMFASIFQGAFSGTAATGAFLGVSIKTALQQGAKRGAFSNEAGMGSAPIAHAAARTEEPVREGAIAAMGPFVDTIIVCTMTALVVLITQSYARPPLAEVQTVRSVEMVNLGEGSKYMLPFDITPVHEESQKYLVENETLFLRLNDEDEVVDIDVAMAPATPQPRAFATFAPTAAGKAEAEALAAKITPGDSVYLQRKGVSLTVYAYNHGLSGFGTWFICFAVFFFAYSTLITWNFYGESCIEYLLGVKAIMPYRVVFVVFVFIGALYGLDLVINFSDAMNGLMAAPNLIACLLLWPRVATAARDYFKRLDKDEF